MGDFNKGISTGAGIGVGCALFLGIMALVNLVILVGLFGSCASMGAGAGGIR